MNSTHVESSPCDTAYKAHGKDLANMPIIRYDGGVLQEKT